MADVIIGIGNDSRGDDGIGPRVARAVPARSGLETMVVQQIDPRLAERLRTAGRVLFIDARIDGTSIRLDRIGSSGHRGVSHSCSPESLLGWMQLAYETVPESWLLSLPGRSFGIGEGLSASAEAMIPDAMGRIERWLDERGRPDPRDSEEVA